MHNMNILVLEEAPGKELLYSNCDHTLVSGFSDADRAGPSNRRLTTGYCVFVWGDLVSWSKRQCGITA